MGSLLPPCCCLLADSSCCLGRSSCATSCGRLFWLPALAALGGVMAPLVGNKSGTWCPTECQGLVMQVRVRVGVSGMSHDVTSEDQDVGNVEGAHKPLCEVVWLSHKEVPLGSNRSDGSGETAEVDTAVDTVAAATAAADEALGLGFDFVLTDSLQAVPFASRSGRIAFLESFEKVLPPADLDAAFEAKEHLLSVLLPADGSAAWAGRLAHEIRRQARAHMSQHTFTDDGSLATYARAFGPYRFSLIADEEGSTVSQAFVHCIGFQTVPLFNGFVSLGAMMMRAVVPFNRTHFGLEPVRATLQDINYDMGWLWMYHRMLLDQLIYRYGRPFEERLASIACTLCRLRHRSRLAQAPAGSVDPLTEQAVVDERAALPEAASAPRATTSQRVSSPPPALAFIGVYSAKANFEKRQAVRETWGRVLKEAYGLQVRFFLGELSLEPRPDDERARMESEVHGDLVVLNVPEGYEMNARKGLLFLEWCAQHVTAEFLLKVDDDVYLRPAPVLEMLRRRLPAGYVWGYFDYLSPVPREEGVPFYNSVDDFPFEAFPPYPRGLLRALSMDVVRRLAAAGHGGQLRMIFGDDPCLGVHLRHLVFHENDPVPLLALDDRDSYRVFAMEPSCLPHLWSHVTPRTWVVHHVTAEQTRCMFAADVAASQYLIQSRPGIAGTVVLAPAALAAARLAAAVAELPVGVVPEVRPLPDVCACLLVGPLAEELASRRDKVNASRTYRMWGDPNAEFE